MDTRMKDKKKNIFSYMTSLKKICSYQMLVCF